MESARTATDEDREILVELADRAIVELTPTRGGPLWARREGRERPLIASIDQALGDPNTQVVVGTIDDLVFGYGIVQLEKLRDGGILGVLSDLYVQPEARGIGVGEAMMDLVIEWCQTRDCLGIDSIALPGNRATKNFFERYGLTARAILVHRSLLGTGDQT